MATVKDQYDTSHPLILAVYVNEYISIYMEESDWTELFRDNESVFDDIDPFSEIVLWNLANESAMSYIPTPDRKPMKST